MRVTAAVATAASFGLSGDPGLARCTCRPQRRRLADAGACGQPGSAGPRLAAVGVKCWPR